MARKEVLFSTCDKCYKEVETDVQINPRRDQKYQLPVGWLHIEANTRQTTILEMDLCDDCKQPVIEAAGRAA